MSILVIKIKVTYRVNFGKFIKNNLTDENIGGGRIVGTCCHYVDLISCISNSHITEVSAFEVLKMTMELKMKILFLQFLN